MEEQIRSLRDNEKLRIDYANEARAEISREVNLLQKIGYDLFIELLAGEIDVKDNRITFTTKNLSKVQLISLAFNRFGTSFQRKILKPILEAARRLLGLNAKYYKEFDATKTVEQRANEQALLSWGYDSRTDDVLPGSYLDAIFAPVKGMPARVAGLLNRAIASKMKLSDFQKQFKAVFLQYGKGVGLLSYQFDRASFDLFQKIDRIASKIYAEKLGLNWAIYSGTVMDETRPFCEARNNKVYSIKQIEAWSELEFQGKPPIYDPFTDCGGYNCRHHLSYVSDTVAEALLEAQ